MKKLLLSVTMLATSGMLMGGSIFDPSIFKDLNSTIMIAEKLSFKVNNISQKPLSIKLGTKNVLNAKNELHALSFVGHEFEPITVTLTYPSGPVSYTVQAPQKGWLIANGGGSNEQELLIYDPKAGNARHLSFDLRVKEGHFLPFTKNAARPELED